MKETIKHKTYRTLFALVVVIAVSVILFYKNNHNNVAHSDDQSVDVSLPSSDEHSTTSKTDDSENDTDDDLNEEEEFITKNVNKEINLKDSVTIQGNKIDIDCKDYIRLLSVLYSMQFKIYMGNDFQKEIATITENETYAKIIDVQKVNDTLPTDVMSLDDLKQEFLNIENDLIIQHRLKSQSYTNYLKGFLYKFIFIKKINQRAMVDSGIENKILYIESNLDDGNIENAVSWANQINNKKRNIELTGWILKAKNALQAQTIVDNSIKSLLDSIVCKTEK